MHIDFALPTHHDLRAGLAAWRHKANAGCADYGLHMAVTSWNDKVRGVCVGWCCAAALCCCAAVLLRCVLRCVLCGVLRAVVLRAVLCVLIHDETRAWWQSTSPPPPALKKTPATRVSSPPPCPPRPRFPPTWLTS